MNTEPFRISLGSPYCFGNSFIYLNQLYSLLSLLYKLEKAVMVDRKKNAVTVSRFLRDLIYDESKLQLLYTVRFNTTKEAFRCNLFQNPL